MLCQIVCEIWSKKFNYSYKIKTSTDHFHVDSFKRKDLRRFQGFWYHVSCRASDYLSEIVILYMLPRSSFYIIYFQYIVFVASKTHIVIWLNILLKICNLLLKGFKIRTTVSDKVSFTIQQTLCVAIHEIENHEPIFWFSCSHIVNVWFISHILLVSSSKSTQERFWKKNKLFITNFLDR